MNGFLYPRRTTDSVEALESKTYPRSDIEPLSFRRELCCHFAAILARREPLRVRTFVSRARMNEVGFQLLVVEDVS